MELDVPCEDCGGSGDCPICGGSGMKDMADIGGNPADSPCNACHRSGDCQTCDGTGEMPANNS